MGLKFRLKGLAETFIEKITCRACGAQGSDDQNFVTDLTRVSLDGIIVIAQCKNCGEIFVPDTQRLGILSPTELRAAVEKDSRDSGEPMMTGVAAVKLIAEKLNAERKGGVH